MSQTATPLHLRVVWLPEGRTRDLYLHGDRLTFEPIEGAKTIATSGYALPGLVDAHCHIGIRRGAIPIENLDQARELARTDRDAGVLTIRDAGSPFPYPELEDESDLPRLIRHGQHISASRRYLRGLGLECEPDEVVDAVVQEAKKGSGWVKLVGDWIDRDKADLAPSFEKDVMAEAIAAAHAEGAKVAVHTFSEEGVRIVVEAGVDSVEHGTGLSSDLIEEMAQRGIALIPTMINIDTFDDIAAQAQPKFPGYADHMRQLKAGFPDVVRAAAEAGVDVYVGTDAGGGINHGLAPEEMLNLHHRAGMSSTDVLAAASWKARSWLGLADDLGDVVVYAEDPRENLSVVRQPQHIILRGQIIL